MKTKSGVITLKVLFWNQLCCLQIKPLLTVLSLFCLTQLFLTFKWVFVFRDQWPFVDSVYCNGAWVCSPLLAHKHPPKKWRTMCLLSKMAQPFKIGSCHVYALTINNDRPSRMVDVRRFFTPGTVLVSGA